MAEEKYYVQIYGYYCAKHRVEDTEIDEYNMSTKSSREVIKDIKFQLCDRVEDIYNYGLYEFEQAMGLDHIDDDANLSEYITNTVYDLVNKNKYKILYVDLERDQDEKSSYCYDYTATLDIDLKAIYDKYMKEKGA